MTGGALVIQGDALHLPLPDESVDLVVTSPPYFSLRSYEAGPQQIGSEATATEYLEALWAATQEVKRVLKPTGSAFINLGDKYGSVAGPKTGQKSGRLIAEGGGRAWPVVPRGQAAPGMREKSLMLLPERYRIGCVDRLGLIARAVIVWNKPNGLPESVTDRVRRSHEDWVHLTRQPRYYSAIDEVREPHIRPLTAEQMRRNASGPNSSVNHSDAHGVARGSRPPGEGGGQGWTASNPLGKLPGSVWTIPPEPLRLPEWLGVDHYAAFPSEWPRRLILGWSPPGICLECNKARSVRESAGETTSQRPLPRSREENGGLHRLRDDGGPAGPRPPGQGNQAVHGVAASGPPDRQDHRRVDEVRRPLREVPHQEALGRGRQGAPERLEASTVPLWPSVDGEGDVRASLLSLEAARRPERGPQEAPFICRCAGDPPTRPAVILDPFGGTGTTAMVARALGRIGLSFDLSHAYSRAARYRIWSDDANKAISRTNRERQGSLL